MGAAVSVVDVDARRPARSLRHQQQGGLEEPPVSQPRRRHVRGRRGAAGRRRPQPRRDRRVDGRGLGRLRQRRLRGSLPLSLGPARAVSQRSAASGFTRVTEHGGPARVGQRQHRRLARLRSRRPARSLRRRLLPRIDQPLEARRHADDAGELRVREQRRPQVPVPQSRRRPVRRGQRAGRAHRRAAGRSRRSPPTCAAPAIPDLFIANDYGVSELFVNEGGTFPRSRPRRGRRLRAEERHERVGRRRAQPGTLRDLRLEHLRGRHPAPGQQPLGAVRPCATALPEVREHGALDGRRSRRLELRRAVRRSQQRRLPRSLPRQRLRLGVADRQLLVRLLEGRRRQPARDLGREELAGDGRPQPGRLSAEEGLDQRRRRPVPRRRADGRRDRPLRRPVGRAGRSVEPRRARRRRRQPARTAAALPQRGRARPRAGSGSISRAAADR